MSSLPRPPLDDDAELQSVRDALRAADNAVDVAMQASVLASLQAVVEREDGTWRGALRAKPTTLRRLLVLAVPLTVVAVEFWLHASDSLQQAPLRVGVSLSAFGVSMLVALMFSLRPLHQAPMPPLAQSLLVGGPIVLALGLSLWPTASVQATATDALRGAIPCLMYGLAVAVPVYVVTRILDRGSRLTGLLAALAAGLSANVVLMTHCPTAGPDHMVLGHFGVIVGLLLAYAAWSRLRALRNR